MKIKYRFIKKIAFIIFIIILVTNIVFGDININDKGQLLIDGKNYMDLDNESYTFGTNIWHTRYIDNATNIPMTEIWKTEKLDFKQGSNSAGQPIILDDIIIATSGDYVYVIDRNTGELIKQGDDKGLRIQWGDLKNKSLYSSPLYISNEDGWFDKDCMPRIYIGTRTDGRMYCYRLNDKQLEYQWHFNTYIDDIKKTRRKGGIVSSPNILLDKNINLLVGGKKPIYLVFGNENGYLYILNAHSGDLIVNGEIAFGGIISSSPIAR